MKRGFIVTIAFFICAFGVSRPLFAHHSSASYDLEHQITLKGHGHQF